MRSTLMVFIQTSPSTLMVFIQTSPTPSTSQFLTSNLISGNPLLAKTSSTSAEPDGGASTLAVRPALAFSHHRRPSTALTTDHCTDD